MSRGEFIDFASQWIAAIMAKALSGVLIIALLVTGFLFYQLINSPGGGQKLLSILVLMLLLVAGRLPWILLIDHIRLSAENQELRRQREKNAE